MFDDFGINAGFVEDLHAQYRQSPHSVEEHWRSYFASLENGGPAPVPATSVVRNAEPAPYTNGTNGSANGSNGSSATNGAYRTADARSNDHIAMAAVTGRVYQLVNAYRVRGHLFAKIDPLGTPPDAAPELDLANFGLTEADYDVQFPTVGIGGMPGNATLRQIIGHLPET